MKNAIRYMLLGVACCALLFGLVACQKQPTWQEQYDLGMRYLSESNYEEAILAFTAAIEIDPKQPDAYLKTAEAYIAIGDIDSAIAALEQGYRQTQDSQIAEQLEMLQNSRVDYSEYFSEDMISQEEITIGGVPFYNLDLSEVQTLLSTTDRGNSNLSDIEDIDGNIVGRTYSVAQNGYVVIKCEQAIGSDTLTGLDYSGYYDGKFIVVNTEIRGISTGDTMREVLEIIGVDPKGAEILSGLGKSILIGADQTIDNGFGWIQVSEESGSWDEMDTVYVNVYLNEVNMQMDFINNRLISLSCYSR